MVRLPYLAICLVLPAATAVASEAVLPRECTAGYFNTGSILDGPWLEGGIGAHDAIGVYGSNLSVYNVCPYVAAKVKHPRNGTWRIKASWPAGVCAFGRPVKVKLTLASDCGTGQAVATDRGVPFRRARFNVARSRCGDNLRDWATEDCDGTDSLHCALAGGCTAQCRCAGSVP